MRTLTKALPALILALTLTLLIACNGSADNDDSSYNQPPGDADGRPAAGDTSGTSGGDAAVSNAIAALGRSADNFQQSVQSLQGEMTMDMSMGEFAFGLNGEFAFKSPDQMHMTMKFDGGQASIIDLGALGNIEVLLLGDNLYMNMALFGGWVKASMSDLGVDAAQYRKLLSDQAPFDYSELINSLGPNAHVQDLGEEDVDGGTYRHYRIDSDFASLMKAVSGAFGGEAPSAGIPTDGFSGPVAMDIWLDAGTHLPHKVVADGSFGMAGLSTGSASGDMTFKMTMVINEYNGNVDIPEAPTDAKSFSEMGAGMFGGTSQ